MTKQPRREPSNRRPEGRDEVTAAVLDAATAKFSSRGPSHVTVREIAEEAGVNHALVHRHFQTKDALLRAVMGQLTPSKSERIRDDSPWPDAVAMVFDRETAHATYARMLAWLLLESDVDLAMVDRFPAIDVLVSLAAGGTDIGDDDRLAVAAVELMALGWQLFGDYVIRMIALDHLEPDDIERRLAGLAASLASR